MLGHNKGQSFVDPDESAGNTNSAKASKAEKGRLSSSAMEASVADEQPEVHSQAASVAP